jgi:hypothetical protein
MMSLVPALIAGEKAMGILTQLTSEVKAFGTGDEFEYP